MSTTQSNPSASGARATAPDLQAIKTRQQAAWSTGDYGIVGTTVLIVAELLCEAVDLRAGERVLDVATGHGNGALAAARRGADATGVDYVPALLQRAHERAAVERLSVEWREGDAEALPCADASFDVVLSTFGVMFAPDQPRAAAELLRVCKPGGRIGLASWTPDSAVADIFRSIGKFLPPAPGLVSPAAWGDEAQLRKLFASNAGELRVARREFVFRYRSFEHWLDVMRTWYGPVNRAFEALSPAQQAELAGELERCWSPRNRAGGSSFVVPSTYLEVLIARAGELDC